MDKDILYINDDSFSHAPSSSWYNSPKKFNWVRGQDEKADEIFLTDLFLIDNFKNKKVYGWLIEPPELIPNLYDFAIKNIDKFEKIFTYDLELLKISKRFEFLPIGGCWIDETDRKIYEKNNLVCSINSQKRMTKLHRFRHEVFSRVGGIDLYGNGYRPVNKKIDVLKNYMFCVVIENQEMDFLFTEKIIDCFVTGTIPIYKGCPSIDKFFNIEGILTFNTIEDLNNVIKNKLNEDLYFNKMKAIVENFETAKKYTVADDIIYEILKNGK